MIKFNTTSWHYRMYRFGSNDWVEDTMSFCPYARKVLRGLILFSLGWTMLLSLTIWNIMGLIFLSQGIWDFNASMASALNVFTAIILGAIGGTISWHRYCEWRGEKQRAQGGQPRLRKPASQPRLRKPASFIATWFKNLHSKMCPTIEFTDS